MRWLIVIMLSVAALAACGGSDTSGTSEPTESPAELAASPTEAAASTTEPAESTATPGDAIPTPRGHPDPAPSTPLASATAPGEAAGTSFTVIELQDSYPHGNARVIVETDPGTACILRYSTPAGTPSEAEGLGEQTAGDDGRITWEWLIGPSTRPGVGSVTISCGDTTETHDITIDEEQAETGVDPGDAGEARLAFFELGRSGDWDALYAAMHPEHQRLVSSDQLDTCWSEQAIDTSVEAAVEAVESVTVDVPRLGEQEVAAVTMRYTVGSVEVTATDHLALVDGEWRWLLPENSLVLYAAGLCPDDDVWF